MSDYYNRNNRRKKRSRREKIGFYTAFSICLIAVCMAVYSTYNTLSVHNPSDKLIQPNATSAVQVNENVTGIKETIPMPKLDEIPTIISSAEQNTVPQTTEPVEPTDKKQKTALETMLSTDLALEYPFEFTNVIREYSEKSVYFKTPNVWKPHTGVDFAAEIGNDVLAMSDGTVSKIYDDKMYGKTVEISTNNVVCIYCGLASADVKKGDVVKASKKIGTVGIVPFEASDVNHIHIAVKIDGKYADPLSFIANNE